MMNVVLCFFVAGLLLSHPVPSVLDVSSALIVLPFILFVLHNKSAYVNFFKGDFTINSNLNKQVILSYLLFISTFVLSFFISSHYDLANALRSFMPYFVFITLLPVILSKNKIDTKSLIGSLILVGALQALLHVALLGGVFVHCDNQLCVKINRITLMDPRTTEPFVFASIFLPLIVIFKSKSNKLILICCFVIFFSAFAVMLTQTRAMIISALLGLIVTGVWICCLHIRRENTLIVSNIKLGLFSILLCALFFSVAYYVGIISSITNRFKIGEIVVHKSAVLNVDRQPQIKQKIDYSNGRVNDEWLPALKRWDDASVTQKLFGIGGGRYFQTASGQKRSYIHNYPLYVLLYNGAWGVFSLILFYLILTWAYLKKAYENRSIEMVAGLSLLISMLIYSLFFAIHKLFSFNFMVVSLIWLVYCYENKHQACIEDDKLLSASLAV